MQLESPMQNVEYSMMNDERRLMELDKSFLEIKTLIDRARNNVLKTINMELVQLYWDIGSYISNKMDESQWGDKTIEQLAEFLKNYGPDYKGFTRRNLYRMKQFYQAYQGQEIVSPLVTQLGWSHHLLILCKGKNDEVVEYALSRSLSPTKIAEYSLKLPNKKMLQQKLHELFENSIDSSHKENVLPKQN